MTEADPPNVWQGWKTEVGTLSFASGRGDAVFSFLRKRINRATYWVAVMVMIALVVIARILGSTSGISEIVLAFICILRMHDLGWSGRWVLLPIAVEVAGFLWAITLPPEQAAIVAGTITTMIALTMVWLGFLKGQPDWNDYGDPPRAGISFPRNSS